MNSGCRRRQGLNVDGWKGQVYKHDWGDMRPSIDESGMFVPQPFHKAIAHAM